MKSALIFAFLLFSTVVLSHSGAHHNCIHDKIAAEFTPQDEPHTEGRILLNGIEDVKKPFRVFFDTTSLEGVGTQEQRDFIRNDLLPLASKFFETRFTIRRRTSPIKMPWDTCYQAKVTNPDHKIVGVDTDLLIYVTAGSFNEGFTAWATACMNDQVNGRPIVGQVNYNLNYLGLKPEEFEANLGTTLHEITHVLGFSSNGFTRFINPDTGKALPRDQLVESISFRGFQTTILKTPKVVELARKHYGCPTIRGVEMENQGGGGSLGSHFERAILMNEAMTASRITNRAYSKFTMAVLEDSGWYYPNYNLSDEFFFGEGAGCEMFEKGCQAESKPREYCYSQQGAYCSLDYYAKGYCGSEGFSDNCLYVQSWGNGDCRDPKNGGSSAVTGEKYGATSKCIVGTLLANGYRASTSESTRCMEYSCQNGKVQLTLVGGKTVTCESDNQKLTVDGYSGYLICPPAKFFCETYYEACPNYCSGKGKCIEGKCMCRPGRTGEDCSQLTGCSNNCNGNGVCQPNGECKCNSGWAGAACDSKVVVDPCAGVSCGANGVCRAGECICNAGFTGKTCNEVVDPCKGVNCNNGVCQSGRCVCNSGWTGVVCNQQIVPVDPCAGKNCGNGVCREGKCVCNNGWTGDSCSVQSDPCLGRNCGNGVCRNGLCVCNSGWSGSACNVQTVDPCAGVSCQNGRCSQGKCICNTGFSGTRCEIRNSSTPTATCPNNCSAKGTCSAGKCYCTYPAYGADCSTVYEQGCADNTCSGNGICYKKKCYCNSNFSGDNCQTKI